MGDLEMTPTPPTFRAAVRPNRWRKANGGRFTTVQIRDVSILIDLYDKRVLTTFHIRDIHFQCTVVARKRLSHLHTSWASGSLSTATRTRLCSDPRARRTAGEPSVARPDSREHVRT